MICFRCEGALDVTVGRTNELLQLMKHRSCSKDTGKIHKEQLLETKAKICESFVKRNLVTKVWKTPYKLSPQKIRYSILLSSIERPDGTMTIGWRDSVDTLDPGRDNTIFSR